MNNKFDEMGKGNGSIAHSTRSAKEIRLWHGRYWARLRGSRERNGSEAEVQKI
jgi:hypothetical protein